MPVLAAGELGALEEVVGQLVSRGLLKPMALKALWLICSSAFDQLAASVSQEHLPLHAHATTLALHHANRQALQEHTLQAFWSGFGERQTQTCAARCFSDCCLGCKVSVLGFTTNTYKGQNDAQMCCANEHILGHCTCTMIDHQSQDLLKMFRQAMFAPTGRASRRGCAGCAQQSDGDQHGSHEAASPCG